MDENAAASLALDAYQALEGIGEDVAQIKAETRTSRRHRVFAARPRSRAPGS